MLRSNQAHAGAPTPNAQSVPPCRRNLRGVLLLAAAAIAGCARAPVQPPILAAGDYAALERYIDELAERETAANHIVGLSIALVDDQRVVWAKGYGFADRDQRLPATPETLYRVGSVSKLFTASAVMQLAEQGRLDIDRPLQRTLSEFSVSARFPDSSPITPRNLMTHHSGLPRDHLKGMWNPAIGARPLLQSIRGSFTEYPPNLLFSYSNLGVSLLGAVIERTTGEPFPQYLQHALLSPLGMHRSRFASGSLDHPLMSCSYRKGEPETDPALRDLAAGGLVSSVTDLGRFLAMVFADGKSGGRQVLQPHTLAEMLRPQNAGVELDRNFRIGLGWMLSGLGEIDLQGAGTVAHHAGATPLFRAQVVMLPKHKLGVAVLANSEEATKTVNELAIETLKLALQAKTGIRQPKDPPVSLAKTPLSPADLRAYSGHYTTTFGLVRVFTNGDRLKAEAFGRTFDLEPRSDGLLALRYRLLGFIPIALGELDAVGITRQTAAGREVLIARQRGQEILVGEKFDPVPWSPAWMARTGEYVPATPEDRLPYLESARIGIDHGAGYAEQRLSFSPDPVRLALQPISDSEALLTHTLSGMGETVLVLTDGHGGEMLEIAGCRFIRK